MGCPKAIPDERKVDLATTFGKTDSLPWEIFKDVEKDYLVWRQKGKSLEKSAEVIVG